MEDYVTFEQALRLKELGFDWYNRYSQMYYATQCYCEGNNPIYFDTIGPGDLISSPKMKEDENDGWIEDEDYCVLAPTLSQVQKWLFERHGYFLSVQYNSEIDKFQCVIYKQTFTQGYYCTNESYVKQTFQGSENLKSYEPTRCLSKGITKVLELLKNNN